MFDAVIGATAAYHEATLLTRDKRASATYDAVGVDYVFV
ncbi:type II toxin-antitoxin system VapC family toxin [Leucobacter insecticola]|uniref:Type II toxin-antitoxin system VapC family toxin n=1 Tax=Leucobacter insecticola TaxID=2714934 RepID=A0A6G8FGY3_9MICO|nr:type II toxin-antitoxin system VapC family toxin [Leucobacter insecticola]QIM15615.1 type II toxin-antitoxin system VapC family toxin [Leucobacter insecticola]